MKRIPAFAAALAAVALQAPSAGPRVTRGPYLQAPEPGQVRVVWYTDVAAEGVVQWRIAGGAWQEARDPAGASTRQEVALPALVPGLGHEYRLPDGRTFTFTAPAPGLQMAVFGDCGSAEPGQHAVAALIARRMPAADSALIVGDVVYPSGADSDYGGRFFGPYASLLPRMVFFAALGNHDVETENGAPYLRVFTLPRNGPPALPPETAYSFERGGVHFVVHDSNLPAAKLLAQAGAWHAADLHASGARFRVAVLHHSPWSSAENSLTSQVVALREALTPFFARTGVDLVLAGHDHTYERTRPLEGVVYVTSGNGGYELYPRRATWPETEVFYNARHGFSALTASGPLLQLEHVDIGECRVDTLQLKKPVARGDAWKLLPGLAEAPAGWTRPEFDDHAWRAGPAGFGFGAPGLATPLSELLGVAPVLHARIGFEVPTPGVVREVLLRLRYDDGFVAWLNGEEVARRNVPAGAGPSATASARHPGDDYETFALPVGLLRPGLNRLAIEVRNVAADDPTLVLVPELTLLAADPGRCP